MQQNGSALIIPIKLKNSDSELFSAQDISDNESTSNKSRTQNSNDQEWHEPSITTSNEITQTIQEDESNFSQNHTERLKENKDSSGSEKSRKDETYTSEITSSSNNNENVNSLDVNENPETQESSTLAIQTSVNPVQELSQTMDGTVEPLNPQTTFEGNNDRIHAESLKGIFRGSQSRHPVKYYDTKY